MTNFQLILASRRRMKREQQLARLAHRTHLAYDWFVTRLVGVPFILVVAAGLPLIVIACRLLTPNGKESA